MTIMKAGSIGVRKDELAIAMEMLVIEIGRMLADVAGGNAREQLDARMAQRLAMLERVDLRPMTHAGIETVVGRVLGQIREPVI